ncbi:MAG: carbohydrate binding domain-containing protein [Bacteroidales bacterium]|nr:carbohydrate binding domain-containing protein [Bacteroidales bacterium]
MNTTPISRGLIAAAFMLLAGTVSVAQSYQMDIDLGKKGAPINSTQYGIFFEDINFAADGGLYAELVKNRSFEFPSNPFQGWKVFGNVAVLEDGPFDRNPHYVRLSDPDHPHRWTGLENEGFFGIGVKAGEEYRFSVWARVPEGGSSSLHVEIVNPASMEEDHALCEGDLVVDGSEWKLYELILKPKATLDKSALRVFLDGKRVATDLEHVSLFPVDTWRGHRNGLRKDLAQALADLQPGIFRFPGGCIVEGTEVSSRYDWKNSVGPVENRPLNSNRWQYCFPYRLYPDYCQSYGLGFFEFFQLSEEIGSEPLPIVSCGLACQFQNDGESAHVPVDDLGPYIQDALDLIEFANGPVTSEWGKVRADMGHPEPFNLKYIGVGNEQWGTLYTERLEPFVKAIRKAYPDIKIVGSSGPGSEGEQFDFLWPEMRRIGVDLVDEHFYRPYEWFLSQGARYDNYDRKGPKVFAGEYACHARGMKWNHAYAALLEAAFMTGIERNADVVHMATYAPLFAHVEGWQWRPDLIWFDNLRSFRTVSWQVQALYGRFRGANTLTLKMSGANVTGAEGQGGLFASAVSDGSKIYVKVANTSPEVRELAFNFTGLKKKDVIRAVEGVRLDCSDRLAENSLDEPGRVVPERFSFTGEGKALNASVPPLCFSVFIIER